MFQEIDSSSGSYYNHPHDNKALKHNRMIRKAAAFKITKKNINRLEKIRLDHCKRLQQEKSDGEEEKVKVTHTDQKHNNFYFKTKVISKVGTLINRLKGLIVFQKPNFTNKELFYIQNTDAGDQVATLLQFENKFVLALELLFGIVALISIWVWTLLLIFPNEISLPLAFKIITTVIFCLEIALNFNTEKCDLNQQIITDRSLAVSYYLKKDFWLDLTGLISILTLTILGIAQIQRDYNQQSALSIILKILMIAKYRSITRVFTKFQLIFATTAQHQTNFRISQLIMKLFCFIHMLSLLFNLVRKEEQKVNLVTWAQKSQLDHTTEFDLYLYGWYWGATMLTTVGFGDIIPGNKFEAFMVSFLEVLCCAVFGYCINYIGSLVSVLGQSTYSFEKSLRRINRHLKKYSVDSRIKSSVKTQLYYQHKLHQLYDPEAQQLILKSLPKLTREELVIKNNVSILKKVHLFVNFSTDILSSLATKLKKVTFSPQQILFNKLENNTRIWIIEQGTVCDFYNNEPTNNQKIITEYGSDSSQTIGLLNFITDLPYYTSARSKSFTVAYELQRKDFIQILKPFKKEYYLLCKLKDTYILKGCRYPSGVCQACHKITHNVMQCPKIHYICPNIYILKRRQQKATKKAIRGYIRRNCEKYSTRLIYSQLNDEEIEVYVSNPNSNSNQNMQYRKRQSSKLSKNKSPSFFNTINQALIIPEERFSMVNQISQQQSAAYHNTKTIISTIRQIQQTKQINENQHWIVFERCKFQDPMDYFISGHCEFVLERYRELKKEIIQ